MKYTGEIDPLVLAYKDEAKRVRRDLHRIPEPGYSEHKTHDYILDYLRELGYEPETVAETGLTLFIPGSIPGEAIALRTDIDALPITEVGEYDYVSEHEGYMHACGHDGHMAMLLVTAKVLAEHPEISHRDLLLVFQPAEEGPGGADKIIASGVFDKYNVGEIYGYHLFPFVEEGVVSTVAGEMMAMTSEFYPVIRGVSSHAGHPENGVDALVAAAQFVLDIQTIISRNVAPGKTALINVGTLEAGERMNIVPGEARLSGTLRSYDEEVQRLLERRLDEILSGIDTLFGTESEINYVEMYPPVINDKEKFERLWEIIPEPKAEFEKVMLSEDFALYGKVLPSVFIGIGTGSEQNHADLHTSGFNFDEEVLLRGIDLNLKIGKLDYVQ